MNGFVKEMCFLRHCENERSPAEDVKHRDTVQKGRYDIPVRLKNDDKPDNGRQSFQDRGRFPEIAEPFEIQNRLSMPQLTIMSSGIGAVDVAFRTFVYRDVCDTPVRNALAQNMRQLRLDPL